MTAVWITLGFAVGLVFSLLMGLIFWSLDRLNRPRTGMLTDFRDLPPPIPHIGRPKPGGTCADAMPALDPRLEWWRSAPLGTPWPFPHNPPKEEA